MTMIPHNKPCLSHLEEAAAVSVLQSGFLTQGNNVSSFEHDFCEFMGLPEGHAVAVSSGTAALYLALNSLTAKNKSVALPVYTCSTLRHAAKLCAAIPQYFDTKLDDCNVDMQNVNASGCDIAIVPHMYGVLKNKKNSKLTYNRRLCSKLRRNNSW